MYFRKAGRLYMILRVLISSFHQHGYINTQTWLFFHVSCQFHTALRNKRKLTVKRSSSMQANNQCHVHFQHFQMERQKKCPWTCSWLANYVLILTWGKKVKFKEMTNLTFQFSVFASNCGIKWHGAISNSRHGSSPWSHLLIRRSHKICCHDNTSL